MLDTELSLRCGGIDDRPDTSDLCFAATTTDRFSDRILCLRIEALGDEMTASQRSMEKLKELDAGSEEQVQRLEKELGITDSPKMGDDDPDWSQKNGGPKLIVS